MEKTKFTQWKISDLISKLRAIKNIHGDLLLEQSQDEEGNASSIIGEFEHGKNKGHSLGIDSDEKPTTLTFWPVDMKSLY